MTETAQQTATESRRPEAFAAKALRLLAGYLPARWRRTLCNGARPRRPDLQMEPIVAFSIPRTW